MNEQWPDSSRWVVRRDPGPGRTFVTILVGAVLGGLIALGLAPYVYQAPQSLAPDAVLQVPTRPQAGPSVDVLSTSQAIVRVAEQVGPSVVGIVNRQRVTDFWGRSATVDAAYGTGVVVDRQGHIVTNAHVVAGHDELAVVLSDGQRVPARLVASDAPYADIAVIKVDPQGLRLVPARFGDSDAVRVGEIVVAIGNPMGLDFFRSVTMGVVSGIRADLLQKLAESGPYADVPRILKVIQTDAAINEGNSGGPLVNLRGEVIGINTLKFGGQNLEGMGFAIPGNDVRAIVSDLIRQGYVSRAALGVSVVPEDVARAQYGVERGLLIARVEARGPADRAGVRPGDVLMRFGDAEVNSFLDLLKQLSRRKVGERVRLTLLRDGRQLTVEVVLGELDPRGRR